MRFLTFFILGVNVFYICGVQNVQLCICIMTKLGGNEKHVK